MAYKALLTGTLVLMLAACGTQPPAANEATISRSGGKGHDWKVVTEAEVAAEIDAPLVEAAKDFVKLRKDGEIVFCKNVKEIGTSIRRIKCITQAQLRAQVEDNDQYRDSMRNRAGKCPMGPQGCRSD